MERIISFAIFLYLLFLFQPVQAPDPKPEPPPTKDEQNYAVYEPSEHFSDVEYELDVDVEITTFYTRYWGTVSIKMKCLQKTNAFFLDQKSITIDEKSIKAWKCYEKKVENKVKYIERPIIVKWGRMVGKNDGYRIKLEKYMDVNFTYKIKLAFSKTIYSQGNGFVYANYEFAHRTTEEMVYTRMRKLHANSVFPCFNRVDMKSKFKIKIGHLQDLHSFTNTKFVSQKQANYIQRWLANLHHNDRDKLRSVYGEGAHKKPGSDDGVPNVWVVDEFEPIDSISTFSIALAVADFNHYPETQTRKVGPPANASGEKSEVEIRIYADEELLNVYHVAEVQKVAAQSLAFFADFFDSTYNLGKMDLIVVRDDDITVEDSYGLIYFGEKTIKYVFAQSFDYGTQRYFLVSRICQAMSTQWIGHYISLADWNEDWFYEGLHTYLRRHCALTIFENWKIDVTLDLVDSFINMMRTEERGDDHDPIVHFGYRLVYLVKLNAETKSKIHLIIRMLAYIMDYEKNLFQKSLINIITEFKTARYANLKDVLNNLTQTARAVQELEIMPKDISVTSIISSWLDKGGHPLINVTRNKAGNVITVTQTPFLFPDQKEGDRCWIIPFEILTRDHVMTHKPTMREWLTCRNGPLKITIPGLKETDWIVLTSRLHVPVRVKYELETWKLIEQMFHIEKYITNVDSYTKIQLITDMFALAEASYLDFEFVFNVIIEYIPLENDYKCWHVIHRELVRVRSRWSGTSLFEPFQEFVRMIIQPIFDKKITSLEEFLEGRHSKHIIEKILIKISCSFEISDYCQKYSVNLFKDLMGTKYYEDDHPISDFLKESFFCAAMKDADDESFDFMLKKYEEKPDTRILNALGCSKNTTLLKKYLYWSWNEKNKYSSAERGLQVFEIVSLSNEGHQLITPFFKTHSRPKLHRSNKDFIALNEFIERIATKSNNINIQDFLMKALEGTKKKDELNMLQEFSNTIQDRQKEKVFIETEFVKIANRNISWLEKKGRKLSVYLRNFLNDASLKKSTSK